MLMMRESANEAWLELVLCCTWKLAAAAVTVLCGAVVAPQGHLYHLKL
jgi:hypothetical protein